MTVGKLRRAWGTDYEVNIAVSLGVEVGPGGTYGPVFRLWPWLGSNHQWVLESEVGMKILKNGLHCFAAFFYYKSNICLLRNYGKCRQVQKKKKDNYNDLQCPCQR